VKQLFIRFEGPDDSVAWLRTGDETNPSTRHVLKGSLADAAAHSAGAQVIVFVPGEDVLLTHINIPGKKSRGVLAQAVPYALEEQLAADVDTLHFALGPIHGDEVHVAIVADSVMQSWSERLKAVGIEANAFIPETLALPLEPDSWSIIACNDDKWLLRTSTSQGIALDNRYIDPLLDNAINDMGEQPPSSLTLYSCHEYQLELPEIGVEISRTPAQNNVLGLLARGYQSQSSINLLQGSYSRRERMGQFWRPWKVPMALAAALLVMQVGTTILDYQRLSSDNDALKQQIIASYKKAFPAEKNVPYPQKQMEQHLRRLSSSGASPDGHRGGFSDLLTKAGQEFRQDKNAILQRVSFKNGILDIALSIGDLQQLDKLKQNLADKGGMTVEIVSAAARGPKVEARLRISEKSS